MVRTIPLALTAFFTVGVVTPLTAQSGYPALGPDLPSSTRAMALGGAYVMDAGRADAVFRHPELLRGAGDMTLDLQRWGSAASTASVSAATSWFGGDLGVGVGVQTVQQTGNPGSDVDGPYAQDPMFVHGGIGISERAAVLGLSAALEEVDWGLSLRLTEAFVGVPGVDRYSDLELGFGAAREVGPVTVGAAYHDVLRSVSELTVGVGGYGWELGFLDVGLSGRLDYYDADIQVGGGLELGYWPIRGRTFIARIGAQTTPDPTAARPFTFGFAYWGDALTVEWAFQPFDGMPESGTHRFSVGWR
ncbi:MAG: hypothetical protein U5R14_13775 [Gemmatimonadota bacterium]|nr:hypothetical protein [Gemmatimonadota bacterium]